MSILLLILFLLVPLGNVFAAPAVDSFPIWFVCFLLLLMFDLHLFVDTHAYNCGVVITLVAIFFMILPLTHFQPLITGALFILTAVIDKSTRNAYCYQQ